MSLPGASEVLWSGHMYRVHAPGSQVFACIASHAQERIISVHNLVVLVDKDSDNAGVHQDVCPLLTLTQGFLDPLLLLDVGAGAKPLDDVAAFITHGYGSG